MQELRALATGVGSMPQKDAAQALDLIYYIIVPEVCHYYYHYYTLILLVENIVDNRY